MSIYKRKDNGKYKLSVSYKNLNGSYSRLTKDFNTRREAVQYEPILRNKAKGVAPEQIDFGSVAIDFLGYCKASIRYTTYRNYEKTYRLHLKPYFEHTKMGDISVGKINEWKRRIESEISPRTKKRYSYEYLLNIWKVLKLIFKRGQLIYNVKNNCLEQAGIFLRNPNAETVEKPLQFWTPNQYKKFMNQIDIDIADLKEKKYQSEYYYEETKILIAICFCCGLRRGEANGLKVNDYHRDKEPFLSIKRSVTDKAGLGRFLITNPKNESSVRNVPVPKTLAKLLDKHISNYLTHEYGFNEEFFLVGGFRPQPSSTANHIKEKIETEANLPHITIHDLRHSYVSMLLNKGVPLATISKLAGHSSVDITYKIYSHLYKQTMSKVANLVDKLVN